MAATRRQFLRRTWLTASMMMLDPPSQYSLFRAFAPTQDGSPPIFYDQDGLIVHKGLDGGDTAQREGWYWFGVWVREHLLHEPWTTSRKLTFPEVLRLLE